MSYPNASHSTIKDLVKSGKAKTGGCDTATLSFSKASVAVSFHPKESFFNKEVSGDAIWPYHLINFL